MWESELSRCHFSEIGAPASTGPWPQGILRSRDTWKKVARTKKETWIILRLWSFRSFLVFPFPYSPPLSWLYCIRVVMRLWFNSILPHSTRSPAIYYGIIAAKKGDHRRRRWIKYRKKVTNKACKWDHTLCRIIKRGAKNPLLFNNYLQFEGNLSHFFRIDKGSRAAEISRQVSTQETMRKLIYCLRRKKNLLRGNACRKVSGDECNDTWRLAKTKEKSFGKNSGAHKISHNLYFRGTRPRHSNFVQVNNH